MFTSLFNFIFIGDIQDEGDWDDSLLKLIDNFRSISSIIDGLSSDSFFYEVSDNLVLLNFVIF